MSTTMTASSSNAIQWDKNLIAKYDTRGPRYTSYPTATEFTTSFSEQDYIRSLEYARNDNDHSLSLYVHIPFCQDICYYCACNKIVTRDKSAADTYLNYLEKEMALVSKHIGNQRKVTQLHFGGGTPTFLNAGQLTRLIHSLSTYFQLIEEADREYSVEIDPRTVTSDTLALLKGLGFNRLSLGVQDFSPAVQKAVNRINSYAMVEDLVLAARDYGFRSINFDLIYGLPEQNLQTLQTTLQQVIQLHPERIAFYNYAHLPERFTSQRAIDRQTLPTPEQKLDMLNLISNMLTEAGYLYIGMDHFVLPNDELALAQKDGKLQRNFQGYSTRHGSDLIGLGVSSISSGDNYFSQNQKTIDDYYSALDKGHLPVEKGLVISTDDHKRRAVIMEMIANLHLDIRTWEKQHGELFPTYFATEIDKLQPMLQDGLLTMDSNTLHISTKGRAMLRNICMIFDKYHKPETGLYSKVI